MSFKNEKIWLFLKHYIFLTYDNKINTMTTTKYTTSDYLTTDEIHRLIRYFKKMGNPIMELLIETGVKTLLRYSDLNQITWSDVLGKDTLILNEKKTNKKIGRAHV